MEEGWRTCSELVKEGKIRYIGVSNFTIEQMDKLQPIHPIAAMEPPYSMIERRIETGILDYCRQHHMGVIIYSPLQQGLLTGTIKVEDLAPNDFRRANPHFKEPELILNLKLAGDLTPIARKYNCSIAQIAIAWTLRKPEVTAALNGARDPSEIEDSVKAADIILADNDIEEIEKLLVERQNKVPPPPPPGGHPGGVPPGLPPGR
jgi:aryl-alcohol dehydrogenase-like predicted oxidoreductase